MNASSFLLILLIVVVLTALLSLAKRLRLARTTVPEYQRGALFVAGSLREILGPGRYWSTATRTITFIDMRLMSLTVPGQEILTADGISLKLTLSGTYSVTDAKVYLLASASPVAMLYQEAQQALREAVAGLSFENLLSTRATLNERLPELLKPRAAALGVEATVLEVRDIVLPGELRRAYAQAVTAQKEGLAALERARAEIAALRSLANAARLLQDHPGLLQLRALQSIEGSSGNTLTLHMRGQADSSTETSPTP